MQDEIQSTQNGDGVIDGLTFVCAAMQELHQDVDLFFVVGKDASWCNTLVNVIGGMLI